MAFPPVSWSGLAWVALVPLFLLVHQPEFRGVVFLSAWTGGIVFWCLAVSWISLAEPGLESWLAIGLMAVVLGFWWPAILLLTRLSTRRLGLPLVVVLPMVWVAGEYLRAYFLTGFPWYYLAHSQFQFLPLIQVSDLTGAWGVSLLVVLVNALFAQAVGEFQERGLRGVSLIPVAAVAVALLVVLGYGALRLKTTFRPGPRIALLQSNMKQERHMGDTEAIFWTYHRLVKKALEAPERPDLIVWPETSYPYGFIVFDPDLSPEALERQVTQVFDQNTVANWARRAEDIRKSLHEWVDQIQVPMLIGTTLYDHRPDGLSKYNTALLLTPGTRDFQTYHKLHLVPFGEYVPLLESVPAIKILTPYRDGYVPSLSFGLRPSWIDFQGLRLAVVICFEDTVPQVTRRMFAEAPDDHPPDLLINQSNDGWFYGSSEHEMHLAISVFRAVEHRVPLARAVNTGVSALIDGNGRVLNRLPTIQEGILSVDPPLDDRVSLYTSWGDWLPILCLGLVVVLTLLAYVRPHHPDQRSSPGLPRAI
jgi:apolipoprotein N-acyltransferase